MNSLPNTHLHPPEKAGALDSRFRQRLQNPRRILSRYIHPGMTVLDLGCGTGFFTLEIARLINGKGKVIASDVQLEMLEMLQQKLQNSGLREQVIAHRSNESSIGWTEKVDFILAFYSFHEMRYIDRIMGELTEIAKPGTKILISEQKYHVPKKTFWDIINRLMDLGFEICERPRIFLSRTAVMVYK